MQQNSQTNGWTLIELLIVLLIITIIMLLCYPSFSQQLRETRRAEAQRALLATAAAQERWFSRHFSYATDIETLPEGQKTTKHYQLELSHSRCDNEQSINCFELTARPKPGSSQLKDKPCLNIKVNDLGQKAPTECWQ